MNTRRDEHEVIVVGAGAAGLLAAIVAAERGRKVLLLEKNCRAGTKILMSGGTRCNITHATDAQGIIQEFKRQHPKQGKFLYSALASLNPRDVIQLFESEGVATKVEPGGKVFPVSDRASDVLEALLTRLQRSGAILRLNAPVLQLRRDSLTEDSFWLKTSGQEYGCKSLILTTGGKSYPGSGTTGDGYEWLRGLGHKIADPRPALTPITTSATWMRSLKGITIPDVELRLVEIGKNIEKKADWIDTRRGSFLFTHFGLSGPSPLDISRSISGHACPSQLQLACDFLPQTSFDHLQADWRSLLSSQGRKNIGTIFGRATSEQGLPKRLMLTLLGECDIDLERRGAELPKAQFRRLLRAVKSSCITVSGTRGFKKAEVTAGGVVLSEIDSRTMQSRIVPNLFVAGELLDLDGPIGGYNFQAAFSTAFLAGKHA